MDDILVFGSTEEEHDQRLEETLKRLQTAGLTLNKQKCEFSKTEISFLGQTISQEGIQADNEKIKAILNFPEPQDVSELRSFLGMVNQMGKFIEGRAEITAPLSELLSVKKVWLWGPPQAMAFKRIKGLLCNTPVLALYSPERETKVTADSSSYGLGAVIRQKVENEWKPVAYASRNLTPTKSATPR